MEDSTDQALQRVREEIARRGLPVGAPFDGTSGSALELGVHQRREVEAGELQHVGGRRPGARTWLRLVLILLGLLAMLPWLAPIFAAAGWWGLANPIYMLYVFLCHQLPERAATLFGYQVAFCWRNAAIYGGLFGFGLLYALSTRPPVSSRGPLAVSALITRHLAKLPRAIPLWAYMLTLAPLALDGFTHMLGLRDGLFNEPTFGSFLVGSQFLSLNWWLRISTGLLAAFGTVWFTFPRLDIYMTMTRVTRVRVRPPSPMSPLDHTTVKA